MIDNPHSHAERSRVRRLKAMVVLVLGVVGLAAGVLVASLQPTRYESTVRLLVGPIGGARETLDAAALLSSTYADLVSSRAVVADVGAALDVVVDPDDVRATADERSRVILLTVEHGDPTVPAAVADALAEELIGLVEASAADVPVDPAEPTAAQVRVLDASTEAERVRDPGLVIIVGAVGLGLAAGWQLSRLIAPSGARIDEEFVRDELGLPYVSIHTRVMSSSVPEDAWDLIAAQLDHQSGWGESARVVAFVPVDETVEPTDVLLHLACAYARADIAISLCDADLHVPLLEPHLDGALTAWSHGSGDVLKHTVTPYRRDDGSLLLRTPGRMELVMTAGDDLASNSVARLHAIIRSLPTRNRLAAVCPPAGASPVAISTALVVDRVVLVVRTGRSSVAAARRAMESFRTIGVEPTAVLEIEGSFDPVTVGMRLYRPVEPVSPVDPVGEGSASSGGDWPVGIRDHGNEAESTR